MKILVIPDTHFPYHRKSLFTDLKDIIKDFEPNRIVHIGDMVDSHSISRYTPNPNTISASDEFSKAKLCIQELNSVTKKIPLDLCLGNHDLRYFRIAAESRIPDMCLKPFRELFEIPKGWNINNEYIIDDIYFTHGKSSSPGKTAHAYGMPSVEGHYHSLFSINYFNHPKFNIWSAYCGSAFDDYSLSGTYAANSLAKSVYGFLVIVDGQPHLEKM
jgi:metallophosphoesterase superfamily enzyme